MSQLVVAIDARLAAGSSTGDSSYWSGLLFGLAKISPDARFLLYSNAERPAAIPDCDKFEWIRLPARNSRWWSLVRFPLDARKRASVVHSQYNLSPLVGPRAITTVHDVSFMIGPEWFRPKDLLLLRRFVPASARRAAKVITVSQTSRTEIEREIPAASGKVSVTPLACPIHIQPCADEGAAKELGIDEPFLLTVGTRWPRKNMQLAIDAARSTPYPLVLSGKAGWGEEKLGSRVRAVGYLDPRSLSSLYRLASIYLAPSRHEGFGLTLLEAFACGCPVICSSGGALPETAGDAAIVMESWEPADWSAAIQRTMDDSSKLNDLKRKGLARVAQFSWEETARLTLEVYEQVAARTLP